METVFSVDDLRKIASYQSYLLFVILIKICLIVLTFICPNLAGILQIISLLVSILAIVFFALLRSVMKTNVAMTVILTILLIFPFVSLIVLFVSNAKATKILQKAGLRVGLFGVSKSELNKLEESSKTSDPE